MKYKEKIYPGKTVGAFLIVLLMMPLGHALMILMEHYLSPTVFHYSAFLMGFAGLVVTILGVFVKGDTRQTCFGLSGAMLFWTGWVEFLFAYYAQRYGTHCDLLGNGIFIGAIWANISWGAYWSWDPKEVWALITFMIYAIAVHDKSVPALRKPLCYHVFMTLAFLSILMTYFGVNYFLGGMHSYA